jgi:predicted acylesterase/phospholipase RssA
MESLNSTDPQENVFQLGLCMAGAVSAGAYTAGVIDFLIQALEAWDQKKKEDTQKNTVPSHKVQIPVMGGASAGGMTGIITSTVFNNPLVHIEQPGQDLFMEHPENKLYHSWVDLTDPDMFSKMLDVSDLQGGKVISALNSSFIEGIAQRVFKMDLENWKPFPDFVNPNLKIFTTLTNLQGFDYAYNFDGSNNPDQSPNKYHSVIHNDYGCFQLTEKSPGMAEKGWIPLNLKEGTHIQEAIDSAMGTGAFPIGLESRTLTRDAEYVNDNRWLKENIQSNPIPEGPYTSLNVDGGVINNEPFEKVRDILIDITGQNNTVQIQDPNTFQSTVIMIEPFPTQEKGKIKMDKGIFNIIGLTLGAMLNQMRSKPADLKEAMDRNSYGQFLITPSRKVPDSNGNLIEFTGEKAIACGALSGFSGFLNKEFRIHDYYLGRYNCQIFLRDYFTLPGPALKTNPIFKKGYDLSPDNLKKFESRKIPGTYQIIPIFEDLNQPFQFPDIKFKSGKNWPSIQETDIDIFRPKIKTRIQKIILNIAPLHGFTKFLIWIGTQVVLNQAIADNLINEIKQELKSWRLLP